LDLHLPFEKLITYDPGQPGISIDVELSLVGSKVSALAKIDTGATHCIFARSFGERLGLVIEDGKALSFRTAAGSFVAFGHNVKLTTAGYSFDAAIYFALHDDYERNVLGRHGWLDRMIIAINDYEGKLYLKPYNE
jgi:hypothetical protein